MQNRIKACLNVKLKRGSHLLLELPQLIIAPAIAGIHGGLHQLAQAEEDISCSSVRLLVQTRTQTVDTPLRQQQKHSNHIR